MNQIKGYIQAMIDRNEQVLTRLLKDPATTPDFRNANE